MNNFRFPYPTYINDKIRKIRKQIKAIGRPATNVQHLELALLMTKEAEIRCSAIFNMLQTGEIIGADEFVQIEQTLWLNRLWETLDKLKQVMMLVNEKEYLALLAKLHEWNYILNFIINNKKK